jgi:hypothetical protein
LRAGHADREIGVAEREADDRALGTQLDREAGRAAGEQREGGGEDVGDDGFGCRDAHRGDVCALLQRGRRARQAGGLFEERAGLFGERCTLGREEGAVRATIDEAELQ